MPKKYGANYEVYEHALDVIDGLKASKLVASISINDNNGRIVARYGTNLTTLKKIAKVSAQENK